jgi:hypothetical protein
LENDFSFFDRADGKIVFVFVFNRSVVAALSVGALSRKITDSIRGLIDG